MSLPLVIVYRKPEKRQPLECLCVKCGHVRQTFRLPPRHIETGLLPVLYASLYLHEGKTLPAVVHHGWIE